MRRAALAVSSGTLLLVVVLTLWFRTGPDRVQPGEVEPDAVAMFAGGQGERLDEALRFIASSPESALVIPNGFDTRWPDANVLCAGSNTNVHCPTPHPDTTRGEAAAIAMPSLATRGRISRSIHEWFGHVDARIVDRECASGAP